MELQDGHKPHEAIEYVKCDYPNWRCAVSVKYPPDFKHFGETT